jgi:hypothetical protein
MNVLYICLSAYFAERGRMGGMKGATSRRTRARHESAPQGQRLLGLLAEVNLVASAGLRP